MFQYNLKSLLLFMLAACLLTWLFFVVPGKIFIILVLCGMMIVPSAVVAGIIYFRAYPQAFAIGCVPPMLIVAGLAMADGMRWYWYLSPNDVLETKVTICLCLIVVMIGGAIAAGVRRLAIWSQQPVSPALRNLTPES